MLIEVVFVNCELWEDGEWHLHVFELHHGCCKIEVLDIKAHESCIVCADGAIP